VGDEVELRGPFASYFVWGGESPVLLAGGGSGVVPLMSMLRHRRRTVPDLPMKLIYSVRSYEEIIYADELGEDALITLTRTAPDDWKGHRGRIDADLLAQAGTSLATGYAFVCGSNGFVESTTGLLLAAGYQGERIRTERFGPSG
jgi:ferredoxin-NADP reductase